MPSVSNPMQQAVFRGCVECIRMLVETPPYYSVDAGCGPDGLRPIHIAAREGHIQTLRFLSSAGACLQRCDFSGCTALHHAATAGQLRAVRWLLRHGAKILLDKRGRSPIQAAADHEYMDVVNVLAKHATNLPSNTLAICSNNQKDSNPASTKPNHTLHNPNSDRNHHRRSPPSAPVSDKDTSDLTTGSVETFSLTSNSSNHQNTQNGNAFSHLHLSETPSKISSSPGDCASSSGNSSLTASTSAPSLSPSASSSSAVSCGCSTSDETTLIKSVVEVSDGFTLAEYHSVDPTSDNFLSGNSLLTSPSPFYLHPPSGTDTVPNSQRIDFESDENYGEESGNDILKKKSQHKRQGSTVQASSSPFFLHPPENLVSETQKVVVGKMAPAPVNPSHSHHHFADAINEPTPKLKVGVGETSSSNSSPPLSPPGLKNGLSSSISDCINKFQSDNKKRENGNINNKAHAALNNLILGNEVKLKNQINSNSSVPPPPPPPPPFPSDNTKSHCPLPNLPKQFNRNSIASPEDKKHDADAAENDYEDIDELTNGKNHYEQTRKLLRSVSAPAPTLETGPNVNGQNGDDKGPPADGHVVPSKPPVGRGKPGVPFIPPHFPTPPQDALIKPSEYLRSIQNKPKSNGTHSNGNSVARSSPRVEETLKALGVQDNHSDIMSPVPEETNAEDEFEEINPERINGFVNNKNSDDEGRSPEPMNGTNETDENNNHVNTISSNKGGCGGIIKAEELMKVHLRKTPMSRTKSAPPLGRVIPDEGDQPQSPNNSPENGHEPLKRTNTNSTLNGGAAEAGTGSKAAVIAELAQSSQVGGVREWKEELKRRQKEQDKAVQKEIEQFYQPVNFVAEVPSTDMTGAPIPDWKRQMMAKKAAERARKEAEEQRRLEIEAKRMAAIPMWRRQLLQRRESDGKYAQ